MRSPNRQQLLEFAYTLPTWPPHAVLCRRLNDVHRSASVLLPFLKILLTLLQITLLVENVGMDSAAIREAN